MVGLAGRVDRASLPRLRSSVHTDIFGTSDRSERKRDVLREKAALVLSGSWPKKGNMTQDWRPLLVWVGEDEGYLR